MYVKYDRAQFKKMHFLVTLVYVMVKRSHEKMTLNPGNRSIKVIKRFQSSLQERDVK